MIYCDSPILEQWIAPPQEDFVRPTWTKLIAQGVMLSNSLEYADWTANPVEPIVCEGCWNPSCARAGLARIVSLGDQLLWLPPRPHDIDEFWRGRLSEANFIRDSVLMPAATWERIRETYPRLPSAQSYPHANRQDLGTLWLREMPEGVRVAALGDVEHCLRAAIASDPLDLDPARELVRSIVRWIVENPKQAVAGRIVRVQNCECAINTFYFDGDGWAAFAVGRQKCLALGPDWVYME